MNSNILRVLRRQLPREILMLLLFASLMLQSATAVVPTPGWWGTRGVLTPGATADDYTVANLGQLKNIAHKAAQELEENLRNGAGDQIHALVETWAADANENSPRDDYAALTVGQLKAVGKLFYDRLAAEYVLAKGSYPWSGTNVDDYALVNIGQLKAVFAFGTSFADINNNNIPDLWETKMFASLDQSAAGDFDGDGLSNFEEWQAGTSGKDEDTDGDGYSDGVEYNNGFDPVSSSSFPGTTLWQSTSDNYRMEHNVVKYPDNDMGQHVWHVNKFHELPNDVNDYYQILTGDRPEVPELPPVPNHDEFAFPGWGPMGSGAEVCRIWENVVSSEFFDDHGIGGSMARVRVVGQYPSLRERTCGLMLIVSSHELNTNDDYEMEETKIISLTIPAGSTESDVLEVTLDPTPGRDIHVSAHEIIFEVPWIDPVQSSSTNLFAETTDDVSSVVDGDGTPSGSPPPLVSSNLETYDPLTARMTVANELKIAKMEGVVETQQGKTKPIGTLVGPPVLPPLNPPAGAQEPLTNVAARQLCIPEHDADRFRIRISGVFNFNTKNPGDPDPTFSLKLKTTGAQNPEHNSAEKLLVLRRDTLAPGGNTLEYTSEWQMLVSDPVDDAHATHVWPKVLKEGRRLECSYDANEIPVFKWINKENGETSTAVPDLSTEDQTHIAELGSQVTIYGNVEGVNPTSKLHMSQTVKTDFTKPVESGREVKIKIAYMADVALTKQAILTTDFKRAQERLAQGGIRLTLAEEIKEAVPLPSSVTDTQRLKMIQYRTGSAPHEHNAKLLDLVDTTWTAPSAEPQCIQVIYVRSLIDEGTLANRQDTSGLAYAPFFIRGSIVSPDSRKMENYVNNLFLSTSRYELDASGNSTVLQALRKPFTLAHEIMHLLTNQGHYGNRTKDPITQQPITPPAGSYGIDAPLYLANHNLMRQGTDAVDTFHGTRRLNLLQDMYTQDPNNDNWAKFK